MTGETFCKDKETLRGLEEALQVALDDAINEKYGDKPDELILRRFREEWHAMLCSESVADVASIHEISMWLREKGYPYYVDYTGGASFLFYLLNISTVDPLPPHYYCPHCKRVVFDSSRRNGFDLQQGRLCDRCKTTMVCDGHDIPWQTLWGYGDHRPLLWLNIVKDAYNEFVQFSKSNWLLKEVQAPPEFELDHFKNQCVQYSRLGLCFSEDAMGSRPDFFDKNIDAATALSTKCLKTAMSSMGWLYRLVTLHYMLPTSFADIVYINGMASRSTQNRKVECFMCKRMGYTAADMIAFREDVYYYLLDHGFIQKDAWRLSERVRKGRGLEVVTNEMTQAKDRWVLKQIEKTRYLSTKPRTLEKLFFNMKLNKRK